VFFVRNQGGDAGDLSVDLLGSTVGTLIDSGDLHITAQGGGGAWTVVSEPGRHRLLSTPNIPNGAIVPVEVKVAFDPASGNQTQRRAANLRLHIALSQSTTGSGSALPDTGATDLRPYAVLAALLLGTGLAIVARRG